MMVTLYYCNTEYHNLNSKMQQNIGGHRLHLHIKRLLLPSNNTTDGKNWRAERILYIYNYKSKINLKVFWLKNMNKLLVFFIYLLKWTLVQKLSCIIGKRTAIFNEVLMSPRSLRATVSVV
jgi:hypothetical protein